MAWWDRLAIVGLGATGFASSYDALRQMALAIHTREALSWAFPIFIDGFIAYGIRALMLLRHSNRGARVYTWFLFLAATGASLWANVLHAVTLNNEVRATAGGLHLGDWAVGVLSMLAPLALAGSVHLFIIMARTAESVPDDTGGRPGQVDEPADQAADSMAPLLVEPPTGREQAVVLPGPSSEQAAEQPPLPVEARGTTDPDDSHAREPLAPAGADHPLVQDEEMDGREAADDWLVDLLPIAREAARKAGRITRDAISADVRAHVALSNDRLGELVTVLREEEEAREATANAVVP
ncbi:MULTISPECIES: DUF2637 domain-containing protein [Streptacidiphilus]|uniref:DUF2637 domain-containing protein n=1 Tax=Streptacidiphilus cavernicola TaxID=3342716 RepID=A0ABV6UP35_9ACTN|nr:DUF2637 domain-containing protein [Streptacidiphilus jeojiense]